MTTAKQQAANRQNALKSTGPRTARRQSHRGSQRPKAWPPVVPGPCYLMGTRRTGRDWDAAPGASPARGGAGGAAIDHIITAAWRLPAPPGRRALSVCDHYSGQVAFAAARGGGVVCDYGDKFAKLSRCETTIERSLYRPCMSCNALQTARAGVGLAARGRRGMCTVAGLWGRPVRGRTRGQRPVSRPAYGWHGGPCRPVS